MGAVSPDGRWKVAEGGARLGERESPGGWNNQRCRKDLRPGGARISIRLTFLAGAGWPWVFVRSRPIHLPRKRHRKRWEHRREEFFQKGFLCGFPTAAVSHSGAVGADGDFSRPSRARRVWTRFLLGDRGFSLAKPRCTPGYELAPFQGAGEGRAHCPNAQWGGCKGADGGARWEFREDAKLSTRDACAPWRTGLGWGGRHHSESDEYCTGSGRTGAVAACASRWAGRGWSVRERPEAEGFKV